MSHYKNILLAVDLTDENSQVAEKAAQLAEQSGATLHIVHVIEPLSYAYGGDIPMDFSGIQEEIQQQSEHQLSSFSAKYGIQADNQHLVTGRPENEIHALADQIGADLIVLGSHGRHGLALLLGSTANGVLHGSPCDVLAVRVGK